MLHAAGAHAALAWPRKTRSPFIQLCALPNCVLLGSSDISLRVLSVLPNCSTTRSFDAQAASLGPDCAPT